MQFPLIPPARSEPIDDALVADIVDLMRAFGRGVNALPEAARLVALCVPDLLEELLTYRRLIGEQYAAVLDLDAIAATDPRVTRFPTRPALPAAEPGEGAA
jgi:hypothetical protein